MNQIGFINRIKNLPPIGFKNTMEMISSPLFIHSYSMDIIVGRVKDNLDKDMHSVDILSDQAMPFNIFRFIIKLKEDNTFKSSSISGMLKKTDSGTIIIIIFTNEYDLVLKFDSNNLKSLSGGSGKTICYKNGKYYEPNPKERENFTYGSTQGLSILLQDINSPNNFIVNVAPESKGRSVEWTKHREHLILIDKKHPINRKDLESGRVLNMNTNDTIIRMAHSRRAHHRILRSLKFKNKVGQKIFIKSSWVGPKEWKDSVGNIYKIRL